MARDPWGVARSRGLGDRVRPSGSRVGGRLSTSGSAGVAISVDGEEGDLALALKGRLDATIAADLRALEQAYWRAMDRVVQAGKGRLRADVVAGGFHKAQALSKTWRANTYPRARNSLDVAGFFHTKAGIIIDAFETGVTIRVGSGHKFLAIPTGPAKAIIRRLRAAKMKGPRDGGTGRDAFGRFTQDDSYVDQVASALNVDLVPILSRDGSGGVLVAANDVTLTRTGREAKNQARKATPLFILTRTATLRRRIKGRALLDEIRRNFPGDFAHALSGELPPSLRGLA
jgi:hypothetical protein